MRKGAISWKLAHTLPAQKALHDKSVMDTRTHTSVVSVVEKFLENMHTVLTCFGEVMEFSQSVSPVCECAVF